MDIQVFTDLISNLGFPIAATAVMGWIAWKLLQKMMSQNEENMKAVQLNCKAREEKLYAEIKENREINAKAIDTIAKYAEKLDIIQDDIDDIKTNITVLTTKVK